MRASDPLLRSFDTDEDSEVDYVYDFDGRSAGVLATAMSVVLFVLRAPFRLWHSCASRQRKSRVRIWKWIHKTDARAALFWAVVVGIPAALLFAVLFAVPAAFIPEVCRETLHVSWIPGCTDHGTKRPVVYTLNTSNITLFSGTLHGSVDPKHFSNLQFFFYFGPHGDYRENQTDLLPLGSATLFSRRISGLEPQTSYQVTAAVQTSDGSPVVSAVTTTFSTLNAPVVDTNEPTNISTTSAVFRLVVIRNGWNSLRGFFSYGVLADASVSIGPLSRDSTMPCSPSYVLHATLTPYQPLRVVDQKYANASAVVSGLLPDTNYAVTAAAITQDGEIVCSHMTASFRTSSLPPPIVTTDSPSDATPVSARLHGTVDTRGWSNLNFIFFYGKEADPQGRFTALQPLNGTGHAVVFAATVTDLAPATTYLVQAAVKNNKLKQTLGNVVRMTTPSAPPPNVTTLSVTNMTQTTATFHGSVDTGVWSLQYFFFYGPESQPQQIHTIPQSVFGKGKGVKFASPVGRGGQNPSLNPNTTYIVTAGVIETAPNNQVLSSNNVSVTTLAIPPLVYTLDGGNFTNQSATFHAWLVPRSWTNLGVYFIYGPESDITKYRSSVRPLVASGANFSVDIPIGNLAANVNYTMQAVVRTSQGDYRSPNTTSFLTENTVLTGVATNVTFYSATLHGTVNTRPNQTNLTFHFCYGSSYQPSRFCSPKQSLSGSGTGVPFSATVPMAPNVTCTFFAAVGEAVSQDVITVVTTLPPKGGLVQMFGPAGCAGSSQKCATNLTLAGSISKMDLSSDGKFLYFAGVGQSQIELGIAQWTGAILSQLPGSEGCYSGSGLCSHARGFQNGSLGNLVISPDDSNLYIGGGHISDSPTGTLESFSRSTSGALTQLSSSTGCLVENATSHASSDGCGTATCFGGVVRDIAVSPKGKFAFVAQGYDIVAPPKKPYTLRGALLAFSRAKSTGALSQLSPPDMGCTYFSAEDTQNPADCSPCGQSDTLGFPSAVAISPDGDSLFVASYWSPTVVGPGFPPAWLAFRAYDLHEDGSLYFKGCWNNPGSSGTGFTPCNSAIPGFPNPGRTYPHLALGVSPDSRFVYFGADDHIAAFSVDDYLNVELKGCYGPAAAKSCTGVPALGLIGGLTSIKFTKDGTNMFAQGSDGLLVFSRDVQSGSLTPLQCFGAFTGVATSCSPVATLRGISQLAAVAVRPDVLFVGGQGKSGPAIAVFSIVS